MCGYTYTRSQCEIYSLFCKNIFMTIGHAQKILKATVLERKHDSLYFYPCKAYHYTMHIAGAQ